MPTELTALTDTQLHRIETPPQAPMSNAMAITKECLQSHMVVLTVSLGLNEDSARKRAARSLLRASSPLATVRQSNADGSLVR